jgi:uncharacterized protein YheU (UPF0270 family)
LALLYRDHMAVEHFDLRHGVDESESVIRLLSQWVAKEVKLLQEGEVLQKFNELLEVAQLVISCEQDLQELVTLDAVDIRELVIRGVDFFDSEVRVNVIEIA